MTTHIKQIDVDFSHRIGGLNKDCSSYQLTATIDDMSDRAINVLKLISCEFAKDEALADGRVSDEIMYQSIEAAIHEILDMRATVTAYFEAERSSQAKPQA